MNQLEKIQAEMTYLETMTIEELKREFSILMGRTIENIVRLAMIVKVLDKKDPSWAEGKSENLLKNLRAVANGKVIPELFVEFANQPQLFSRLSTYPIDEQKRLVDNGKIPVAKEVDGEIEVQEIAAREITDPEVRWRVFGKNGIATPKQQVEKIKTKQPLIKADRNKVDIEELPEPAQEKMVASASPKDAAEYIFGLVLKAENPELVAFHLMEMLKNVKSKTKLQSA